MARERFRPFFEGWDDDKNYANPEDTRRRLEAAGAEAVELSADGTATLAGNEAGRALGDLLTPWKPQETGERGTAAGDGPEEADGETPEGEIRALMDKEGISYREAAIRLSGRSQEVG